MVTILFEVSAITHTTNVEELNDNREMERRENVRHLRGHADKPW